jgi:5-deoxy-glucuronate isomerase
LAAERDPVVLDAATAGWSYCGLQVVQLGPGESRRLDLNGTEAAVFPLMGAATVDGIDTRFELRNRSSVFEQMPDIAYLPAGESATMTSYQGGAFAVATSVADAVRPARFYPAEDVKVEIRGAGQATRQINALLSADVVGPQRLIVVEVLAPGGNWSSFPPHKHDEWSEVEVPVEEIYYFLIRDRERPRDGFGLHRTYTLDGEIDETVEVRSGDVFLVPRGYHGPCVAAPGFDMYYLNVMAGPDPHRRWMLCTDPAYAWLWDAWKDEPRDPRVPLY